MTMLKKMLLALSVSLVTAISGCDGAGGVNPPGQNGEDVPGKTAMSTPDCSPTNAPAGPAGPRVRVTLNADGTVYKMEGMNSGGNWESERGQQNDRPESFGACLTSIDIHALNESTKELKNDDGTSTHSHAGPSSPPYNTHCHRWVRVNNVNYLVHC